MRNALVGRDFQSRQLLLVIYVTTPTQALLVTCERSVVCELGGKITQASELHRSTNVSCLHGAANRAVAIVGKNTAILRAVPDGKVLKSFPLVRKVALSADGAVMAACSENESGLVVINAKDSSERLRLALGPGEPCEKARQAIVTLLRSSLRS